MNTAETADMEVDLASVVHDTVGELEQNSAPVALLDRDSTFSQFIAVSSPVETNTDCLPDINTLADDIDTIKSNSPIAAESGDKDECVKADTVCPVDQDTSTLSGMFLEAENSQQSGSLRYNDSLVELNAEDVAAVVSGDAAETSETVILDGSFADRCSPDNDRPVEFSNEDIFPSSYLDEAVTTASVSESDTDQHLQQDEGDDLDADGYGLCIKLPVPATCSDSTQDAQPAFTSPSSAFSFTYGFNAGMDDSLISGTDSVVDVRGSSLYTNSSSNTENKGVELSPKNQESVHADAELESAATGSVKVPSAEEDSSVLPDSNIPDKMEPGDNQSGVSFVTGQVFADIIESESASSTSQPVVPLGFDLDKDVVDLRELSADEGCNVLETNGDSDIGTVDSCQLSAYERLSPKHQESLNADGELESAATGSVKVASPEEDSSVLPESDVPDKMEPGDSQSGVSSVTGQVVADIIESENARSTSQPVVPLGFDLDKDVVDLRELSADEGCNVLETNGDSDIGTVDSCQLSAYERLSPKHQESLNADGELESAATGSVKVASPEEDSSVLPESDVPDKMEPGDSQSGVSSVTGQVVADIIESENARSTSQPVVPLRYDLDKDVVDLCELSDDEGSNVLQVNGVPDSIIQGDVRSEVSSVADCVVLAAESDSESDACEQFVSCDVDEIAAESRRMSTSTNDVAERIEHGEVHIEVSSLADRVVNTAESVVASLSLLVEPDVCNTDKSVVDSGKLSTDIIENCSLDGVASGTIISAEEDLLDLSCDEVDASESDDTVTASEDSRNDKVNLSTSYHLIPSLSNNSRKNYTVLSSGSEPTDSSLSRAQIPTMLSTAVDCATRVDIELASAETDVASEKPPTSIQPLSTSLPQSVASSDILQHTTITAVTSSTVSPSRSRHDGIPAVADHTSSGTIFRPAATLVMNIGKNLVTEFVFREIVAREDKWDHASEREKVMADDFPSTLKRCHHQ